MTNLINFPYLPLLFYSTHTPTHTNRTMFVNKVANVDGHSFATIKKHTFILFCMVLSNQVLCICTAQSQNSERKLICCEHNGSKLSFGIYFSLCSSIGLTQKSLAAAMPRWLCNLLLVGCGIRLAKHVSACRQKAGSLGEFARKGRMGQKGCFSDVQTF